MLACSLRAVFTAMLACSLRYARRRHTACAYEAVKCYSTPKTSTATARSGQNNRSKRVNTVRSALFVAYGLQMSFQGSLTRTKRRSSNDSSMRTLPRTAAAKELPRRLEPSHLCSSLRHRLDRHNGRWSRSWPQRIRWRTVVSGSVSGRSASRAAHDIAVTGRRACPLPSGKGSLHRP